MQSRLLFSILALAVVVARVRGSEPTSDRPVLANDKQIAELIKDLRSNESPRRRADAASELREVDAKTYPQIVTALVHALKNDRSASVRREVAHSLGKIRPITDMAGDALEAAAESDSAIGVRAIASAHLRLWIVEPRRRSSKLPIPIETSEPPLADP